LKLSRCSKQRQMMRAKSCSMSAAPNGPRANSLKSSRVGAMMALRARHSGSAALMALHKALRITLTKSWLLADKPGPTGSFG
jgi:hypothetical protein